MSTTTTTATYFRAGDLVVVGESIGRIDGPAHEVHGDDLFFVDGLVDGMSVLTHVDSMRLFEVGDLELGDEYEGATILSMYSPISCDPELNDGTDRVLVLSNGIDVYTSTYVEVSA